MNLRDITGLLQGHWRTCGAIGCGCLGVVAAGAALAICPILFGIGAMFAPDALPTASSIVRPVMLESNQATAPAGHNDVGQAQPPASMTDRALLPYMPYQPTDQTWANSSLTRGGYLGWANLTGARRTPYQRGQRLSYPNGATMTVITADFDFTLLQDDQGQEWSCPANVDQIESLQYCQAWQRGKF